uniref:Retrovirus-related Pol polyprotein from transposon TNT 1-94-like beta-barrel domain-containing protein n=1 Tax=Cajanus cajan TaxID=3821 RepID=A0A151RL44_CAJCA|nr:hypothetical protein KK1_035319 [Cajanus cajan]
MTSKEATWIIDTGASNHMTGNLRSLHEIKTVQGCPVGLPNEQQTMATNEGTIILEGGLKLENVLYVPKLNCSLIFVSQLIDATNCIVQFTNSQQKDGNSIKWMYTILFSIEIYRKKFS